MTAKKPQDHKPKKLPVKDVEGGKEVKFDGLTIVLRDAAFRDHHVLQMMAKMRKDDLPMADKIILNGEMIDRVLGEEQAKKFVAAYADEHGFTDFTTVAGKFNEIVGAVYPNS